MLICLAKHLTAAAKLIGHLPFWEFAGGFGIVASRRASAKFFDRAIFTQGSLQ
jgi:hypothetical protein